MLISMSYKPTDTRPALTHVPGFTLSGLDTFHSAETDRPTLAEAAKSASSGSINQMSMINQNTLILLDLPRQIKKFKWGVTHPHAHPHFYLHFNIKMPNNGGNCILLSQLFRGKEKQTGDAPRATICILFLFNGSF